MGIHSERHQRMISIDLDEAKFSRTALELAAISNRALVDVTTQFAKVAVDECVRMTPPMTYGSASSESGLAQKRMGLNATRAGVNRAFQAWPEVLTRGDNKGNRGFYSGLSRVIRKRNWGKAGQMVEHGLRRTKGFRPAATEELHQEQRRNGRVPDSQWPYIVPTKTSINQVRRRREARSGMAKSGWMPAALALGSKLSGFAWIRNKGGQGGVILPTPGNPQLVVWNSVLYMQQPGMQLRIIERALQSTIYKMGRAIEIIAAKRLRT